MTDTFDFYTDVDTTVEVTDFETAIFEDALSQNSLLNDLFFQSLEEGDLESAQMWGEFALQLQGIDVESLSTGTDSDDLENFNPEVSEDVYNVSDAMEHWECQGNTERCAQFAQLFVIEEMTGLNLDPDEFCAFSEANGWFDESRGTSLEDMTKMLDYYGIENEMSTDNSFEDLKECLDNGGRVIVGVDADEYWYNEGFWGDLFDGGQNPNHAIEVIGYDAEKNCVIVNDSGISNGCGCEIPLDTFLDAWADSNNMMIECYGVATMN